MVVSINAEIIREALDDEKFKAEVIEFLNDIVNEELEKGNDMDTALITDCVEMVFELENGYEVLNLKRESADKIIKLCHRQATNNRGKQIAAAAVALIILTSGVTLNANPALAQKAKDFFVQIINALSIADKETDEPDSDVVMIYLTSETEPSLSYDENGAVDLTGITVYAIHEDGSETEVPLSDCRITEQTVSEDENEAVLVIVSYKGKSASISFPKES